MDSDLDRYLREDLRAVLMLVRGSAVRELELRDGAVSLRLRRAVERVERAHEKPLGDETTGGAVGTRVEEPRNGTDYVTAPMVGIFYHSEQPGGDPLVTIGSDVESGTVIGVIEALQVMTEVEAGCDGRVERIVAGDGEPVEYGQVLVEVRVDDRV